MEKKYTMQEFEKMYKEKMAEVIKEEIQENKNNNDAMAQFMLNALTVNTLQKLETKLFGKEGK